MRILRSVRLVPSVAFAVLVSVSTAPAQETPLTLTGEGVLTAAGPVLPWPADPKYALALDVRVQASIKSATTATDAAAELVDYFNATARDGGFVVTDPATGPLIVGWNGRWTNSKGFLLQGSFAGQRARVVSQDPPVIALTGTAEVRGLSGRGRGLVLKGTWGGELNTRTGALRFLLAGPAVGELGPPIVVCGEYTDEDVAGELQELMKRPDGSVNLDHFYTGDSYPHPFPYSTNPPTSGPHRGQWVPEGIYTTPRDDEMLAHNLEHGQVLILYHPSVAPEIVARLTAIAQLYLEDLTEDLVLAPRPANDVPVALSSFGRLLKMKEFDEPTVQDFIDRNRGHGPECFH